MNDIIDKENLSSKLDTVIGELDRIHDPLDKIDRIADFVKEILVAYGTNEVVLATPDPDLLAPEDLEDCITNDYSSPDEFYKHLKSGNKIIWDEPYWIYHNEIGSIETMIYFYNRRLWTIITIVRLGIIHDKLMITLQLRKGEDEYCENYEKETDWIKPGNFYSVEDWIDLAKLLFSCDDIWKYNKMYPGLRKIGN